MRNKLRDRLNRLPAVLAGLVLVIVVAVSATVVYLQVRPEPLPANSRYADTIYRKCIAPECGHVLSDSRLDLLKKGYMPFERVGDPLGDGRRCPKCGRLTLRFAAKDAQGSIAVKPAKPEED